MLPIVVFDPFGPVFTDTLRFFKVQLGLFPPLPVVVVTLLHIAIALFGKVLSFFIELQILPFFIRRSISVPDYWLRLVTFHIIF
jgi:hypothetical protein